MAHVHGSRILTIRICGGGSSRAEASNLTRGFLPEAVYAYKLLGRTISEPIGALLS